MVRAILVHTTDSTLQFASSPFVIFVNSLCSHFLAIFTPKWAPGSRNCRTFWNQVSFQHATFLLCSHFIKTRWTFVAGQYRFLRGHHLLQERTELWATERVPTRLPSLITSSTKRRSWGGEPIWGLLKEAFHFVISLVKIKLEKWSWKCLHCQLGLFNFSPPQPQVKSWQPLRLRSNQDKPRGSSSQRGPRGKEWDEGDGPTRSAGARARPGWFQQLF